MIKKYKPCNRKELRELVKDESICLSDIDTSLITDMSWLFCDSIRMNFDGLETWTHRTSLRWNGCFTGRSILIIL